MFVATQKFVDSMVFDAIPQIWFFSARTSKYANLKINFKYHSATAVYLKFYRKNACLMKLLP